MITEEQVWKYLSGDLSPQEEKEVVDWSIYNATNQRCFSELKLIWMATNNFKEDTTTDNRIVFDNLISRIETDSSPDNQIKKRKLILKHLLRVAAVIILLYSLSLSYYSFYKDKDELYTEVISKRGKLTEINLPDGTLVWLNSESSIKYPNKLSGNKVDIFLEGEAYFDVTKLKGRDFTVNAGEIEITVQGTSFNVKAYKNDKTIETTLEEGKITITNKNKSKLEFKPVIMRPNQHLIINSTDNIYKLINLSDKKESDVTRNHVHTRNINMENSSTIFTAWKDGVLIFKNKRFEDLEKELERWYDVQIILEDPELKEVRYTGVFEKESLESALKALSLSLPFKYTITPDSVIIKPNVDIINN